MQGRAGQRVRSTGMALTYCAAHGRPWWLGGVAQEALAAGLQQLCPRANVLTPSAVQRALAAGLSVRAWGVKDMAVSG